MRMSDEGAGSSALSNTGCQSKLGLDGRLRDTDASDDGRVGFSVSSNTGCQSKVDLACRLRDIDVATVLGRAGESTSRININIRWQ